MSHRYRHSGLVVDAACPLPMVSDVTSGRADVTLQLGRSGRVGHERPAGRLLLEEPDDEDGAGYAATEHARGYTLRFNGCVDFHIDADLRHVEVVGDPDSDPGYIPILFSGTVISFLLTMRGHHVLHASAIQLEDRAVAFVGESGQGKTTVAAMLCCQGARLVTDDVLRVDLEPAPIVHRGGPELRLRPGSRAFTEGFVLEADHYETSDARMAVRPRVAEDVLPLAAVVIPLPVRGLEQVRVRRLAGVPALTTLLRYPRVLGWEDDAVLSAHLAAAGRLVETTSVLVAEIPWGPPFPPGAAVELLDLLTGQISSLASLDRVQQPI